MQITPQVETKLDWVTCTFPARDLDRIFDLVGGDPEQMPHGHNGYLNKTKIGTTEILTNNPHKPGVARLTLTGQSLDAIRGKGGDDMAVLHLLRDLGAKVSRIDLALDASGSSARLLDLDRIDAHLKAGHVATHFRARGDFLSGTIGDCASSGRTLSVGSRESDSYVKFYDKAAERGLSDSWECIRCELELKRKRAHHAFEFLAQYGVRFAAGIIAAVIDFKEPSDLANKTRQPRAAWWDEVIESAKPVRLVVAKVVDSIERAYLWIERQVGPMLSALVDAAGGEFDVLRDIVDRSRFRQRPKHVRIVASACALLGGT